MKDLDMEELTKESFMELAQHFNKKANLKKISEAYDFALEAHKGQKRESGEDFFLHSRECAYYVASFKVGTDAICAALLHDVLEDTETKPKTIEKRFGSEVFHLVESVTKEVSDTAIQDKRAENLRKILLATVKDVRVILIKLADRLHNMKTLKHLPVKKQKEIARETLEIYVPIAYKLGMSRVKSEFEDLSLKHLQPEIYQQLKKKIMRKKEQREKQVQRIKKAIQRVMGEANINVKVSGRAKNFYSIYKKMIKKNLKFEEIRDLLAFRVITTNKESCYEALNAIQAKWKLVPGEFDDYIKNQKPNFYQSLHVEVVFNKTPVEIQIRTHQMHHTAEEGIAAHWQYKETERDKKFDRRISWLKQILEWRQNETAQELIDSFRIDIFKDEIYVLTPKGDPIPLPEKATPLDFAYAVHSQIGKQCKAAKVNGKMQPLGYELQSADVVEIITAKNAKPTRLALKYAKTNYAREKIRKALGIIQENPKKKREVIKNADDLINPTNLPMNLQKCCYVHKGEKVMGVKTKNTLNVHSKYCGASNKKGPYKKIRIEWKKQIHTKKHLQIKVQDRTGIFADILGVLTREDVKINSINTKSEKKSLTLLVQTSGEESQIKKTIPKLKQIKNVISVRDA